jgi:hypothetical protein
MSKDKKDALNILTTLNENHKMGLSQKEMEAFADYCDTIPLKSRSCSEMSRSLKRVMRQIGINKNI